MRSLLTLTVLLAACESGPTLSVAIKTDYVPGVEFTQAEIEIGQVEAGPDGSRTVVRTAAYADDYRHGLRLADYGSLARGSYALRVSLRDRAGGVVAERPVHLLLNGSLLTTVVLSRQCGPVQCPAPAGDPALTACHGGHCVSPDCTVENTAACGNITCSDAAHDCATASACTAARCEDGICFYAPLDGACPPGDYCDFTLGCRPLPAMADAGVPIDGAVGPDAAVGRDAGPPVDGGCMMACPDDGMFCNGSEICVAAACTHSGSPCTSGMTCDEPTDTCIPPAPGCDCTPGDHDTPGCGNCGHDDRVCMSDCHWGPYAGCSGEGVCAPGDAMNLGGCANCGTRWQRCDGFCSWQTSCEGMMDCSPGTDERTGACDSCNGSYRHCNGGCGWESLGCQLDPGNDCTDGDSRATPGGSCSCSGWTQMDHCSGCHWVTGGCEGGPPPCDGMCSGVMGCNYSTLQWCFCDNGSWVGCDAVGSC